MRREAIRLLLAVGIWTPAIALVYQVEVVEEAHAAARWQALFSSSSRLSYRLFMRDSSGRESPSGILKHEITVKDDRANLFTGFDSPGLISGHLSTVVSRTGGFVSAEGEATISGQKMELSAERAGDIVHIRIDHPGGTTTRRLPSAVLSPESTSGFSTVLPFRDVKDFRPGRQWETFLLDLDNLRVRPSVAVVDRSATQIDFAGRQVSAYAARTGATRVYKAWYLESGRVIKQVIPIGNRLLILERMPDEE